MLRLHKTNKAVRYIINHLRKEDKEELKNKYGKKYKKSVFKELSQFEFDLLVEKKTNRPFLMGGIINVDKEHEDTAMVWLLGTDLCKKYQFDLVKLFLKELQEAEKKYFYFYNYIYKSQYKIKNFLTKQGFVFLPLKNVRGWELFLKIKKMKGLS